MSARLQHCLYRICCATEDVNIPSIHICLHTVALPAIFYKLSLIHLKQNNTDGLKSWMIAKASYFSWGRWGSSHQPSPGELQGSSLWLPCWGSHQAGRDATWRLPSYIQNTTNMISQAANENPERDPGSFPPPVLERGTGVMSSHFPHPTHVSHAHPMHCLCLCLALHLPTPPEIWVLGNQIWQARGRDKH